MRILEIFYGESTRKRGCCESLFEKEHEFFRRSIMTMQKSSIINCKDIYLLPLLQRKNNQNAKGNSRKGNIHLSYSRVLIWRLAYLLKGGPSYCSTFTSLAPRSSTLTSVRISLGS
jgi:hypothetical protein